MDKLNQVHFTTEEIEGDMYFLEDRLEKSIINKVEHTYTYNEHNQIIRVQTDRAFVDYTYDNDNIIMEKHYDHNKNLYYTKWLYYNNKGFCDHIIDSYGLNEWYDIYGNVTETHPYL